MKKGLRILFFLLLIAVLVFVIQERKPQSFTWTANYWQESKEPFGTFILDKSLHDIYSDIDILYSDSTIYNTLKNQADLCDNTLYFIIGRSLFLSQEDMESLEQFVSSGNTVFWVSNFQYGANIEDAFILDFEWAYDESGPKVEKEYPVRFTHPDLEMEEDFQIKLRNEGAYFRSLGEEIETLSNLEIKQDSATILSPHFIRAAHGDGFLYLHSLPELFSNYQLENAGNRRYLEAVFASINPDFILMDDYYKMKRPTSVAESTPLKVLLKEPAFRWIRNVSLLGIAFLFFSQVRRKQRAIPIVTPKQNETIDFVETLGMLYYNDKGHKGLAAKKIKHFFEYLRRNYYLQEIERSDRGIEIVARKTGLDRTKLKKLFSVIKNMDLRKEVFDTDLESVNRIIDELYRDLGAKGFS